MKWRQKLDRTFFRSPWICLPDPARPPLDYASPLAPLALHSTIWPHILPRGTRTPRPNQSRPNPLLLSAAADAPTCRLSSALPSLLHVALPPRHCRSPTCCLRFRAAEAPSGPSGAALLEPPPHRLMPQLKPPSPKPLLPPSISIPAACRMHKSCSRPTVRPSASSFSSTTG
jgi:hypothetical protein